jgi:hypothetical protein
MGNDLERNNFKFSITKMNVTHVQYFKLADAAQSCSRFPQVEPGKYGTA